MNVFDNKYLRRIVYSIQVIVMILLMIMAYYIQLIPMKYLIGAGIVFILLMIGEYFLIFTKKPNSKRSLVTQVLSIMLSCFLIVGSFYIYKIGETFDLTT